MKQIVSKNLILVLAVIAALATGTVLVAGYVDGSHSTAVATPDSKCTDCPKEGTPACCKISGTCEKTEACATPCEQGTCTAKPASGCCQAQAQGVSCADSGCKAQAASPCGAGGCAHGE